MSLDDLTLSELHSIMDACPVLPNPFHELAKKHDCDLEAGDFLIVPGWLFRRFPELEPFRETENVHVISDIETVYSLRASQLNGLRKVEPFSVS